MTYGLKVTTTGATVSPNLGLAQSVSDDVDAAAMQFGSDLLCRIDPRDVLKPTQHPTGSNRVNYLAPNRDMMVFQNDNGVSVGPVSGLYNGHDVFTMTAAATNDLTVHLASYEDKTAFSIMGVAHFDTAMLGSGFHSLLGFHRDGAAFESMLVHQYATSNDYVTAFSDQPAGGGENHLLDGSSPISADTPFAFLWCVLSTGQSVLYLNDVDTNRVSGGGSNVPTGGVIKLRLGRGADVSQQWVGALGRTYLFDGDILSTAAKTTKARALMLELQTQFGIA